MFTIVPQLCFTPLCNNLLHLFLSKFCLFYSAEFCFCLKAIKTIHIKFQLNIIWMCIALPLTIISVRKT